MREDVDASLSFTVSNQKRQYLKFDRAITEEVDEKRENEEIIEQRKSPIRLELEGEDENNTFSPGEIIRGKIIIEDSKISSKIRKAELILGAIEFVQAQGLSKRTEIRPKYKEKIEWNKAGDNSSSSAVVPFKMRILQGGCYCFSSIALYLSLLTTIIYVLYKGNRAIA